MELDLRLGYTTPKHLFSYLEKPHDEPRVQLDLMPFVPIQRHSTPLHDLRFSWQQALSDKQEEELEDAVILSSPNSNVMSSVHTDTSQVRKGDTIMEKQPCLKVETDQKGGKSSRTSDEEENDMDMCRKKLRLSKEQKAFLEESFKEHHTLNQRQKLVLANQLSLRPRQVEVWFQNRRARTKLKQTEVDCEYLRRYCETLREENKKLQKELEELRALNNTVTTLTMCPSCEGVAISTSGMTKSSLTTFFSSKIRPRNTTEKRAETYLLT